MWPTPSVEMAAAHHNVSAASRLEAQALAAALRSGTVPDALRPAVANILYEASFETLVDWVAEGATTFATLDRLAKDLLPEEAVNRRYIATHCP